MPQSKSVESGLAAELTRSVDANTGHRMHQILLALDDEERIALRRVMEKMFQKNGNKSARSAHGYSYKWLADTLTKHGHAINKHQVRHYMVFIYPKERQPE